jgi:hypothetical protein
MKQQKHFQKDIDNQATIGEMLHLGWKLTRKGLLAPDGQDAASFFGPPAEYPVPVCTFSECFSSPLVVAFLDVADAASHFE